MIVKLTIILVGTCRSPGTSPTAVPSDRTQMTSGGGDPRAAHSTTAPVVLLKSTRFGGSFINIGPMVSSSQSTDPVTMKIYFYIRITNICYTQL